MRRLAALALLLSASPALGAVDPKVKAECMKAQDFLGCVKALSSDKPIVDDETQIGKLRSALKLLPSRLQTTNLRDFTSNTQIYTDAVASIDQSQLRTEYELDLVQEALAIRSMLTALQGYWSTRVNDATNYNRDTYEPQYYCSTLRPALARYNSVAGPDYQVQFTSYTTSHGIFGYHKVEHCKAQEGEISSAIIRRVNEALVDPEVKLKRLEQAKKLRQQKLRLQELERMEPWSRRLEENPGLKAWAEANPEAAEKEKERFLQKHEQQQPDKPTEGVKTKPIYRRDCAKQPTKELFAKCMNEEV